MQSSPTYTALRITRVEAPALRTTSALTWALRGLPFALSTVALGLRLPYLLEVPGFTDEGIDVRVALDVLSGRWPLVDAEPYIGALFNYLVATGFLVFGPAVYVPRLVVALFGALTVGLTYLLVRRLAGTLAAVLAAGLLATSGVQVVLSHIAWSNCITPFFTTACMLAAVEATARRSPRLLVVVGGLFGLALQTHVSAIFLMPALLVHLWLGWLHADRAVLRTRWPYLGLAAATIAYANVIAFNVLHPGAWGVAAQQKEYAYVAEPSLAAYADNLSALIAALVRMLGSSFFGDASLLAQLIQPANLACTALAGFGIVLAVRRRLVLPLLGPLGAALGMPWINQNYDFPIGVRYLGFILPLLYLLLALPLVAVVSAAWARARWLTVLPATVSLALLLYPSVQVARWADQYLRDGATSPQILALTSEARARYQAGFVGEVLLDPQLDWVYTAPGGRALRAFDVLLDVQQVPHSTVWMVPEQVQAATTSKPLGTLLIVSDASRERLGDRFGLVPLTLPERPYLRRNAYWAYLLPAQRSP